MSDPHLPGDKKDIANRFRRLSKSDEDDTTHQNRIEFIPENVDQDHVENVVIDVNENIQAGISDYSGSTQPSSELIQEENSNHQEVEENFPANSEKLNSVERNIESNEIPSIEFPQIDEFGMPLPGRSRRPGNQSRINGGYTIHQAQTPSQVVKREPEPGWLSPLTRNHSKKRNYGANSKHRSSPINVAQGLGCLLRMLILAGLAGFILLLMGGTIVLYEYYKISATLPSVADLQQRASAFETTRIFDRTGNLLYEILDPTAGRRTFITLDKISPYMVAATIATEDKSFYSHPGFDWTAIVRAFWQNFQGGETISGASTITQQVARGLLLSPEERNEQTYIRKVREALLAAEITRRYSKDQILELYLNEFYYGNLAYGIEAAAETYFNMNAANLDLAQSSLLAGLPQAPSVYDVYQNRDAVRERQKQVLTLMYEASNEQGCIYVSNSPEKICVDAQAAVDAYTLLEAYQFNPPEIKIKYPHWVQYIRSILESQFDAQTIYRSGFSVYTTLDPALQDEAEKVIKRHIETLNTYNANNGALVAIRPSSGQILAMVGSADFYNESIDGQVNMAISPTRQPGSSIKPITYIAAFEKGWTPGTLIWDVPTEFPPSGDPNDPRPPYKPVNYDGRFHGPVTVRSALANSYNIPAVKALQFAGIQPGQNGANDGMLAVAKKMGINSLTRSDYGLSLTLGGGEVSLLDMTGAYSVIANNGKRLPPIGISRILDRMGNIVFENSSSTGEQVIRPEHAFLISSILSDNDARSPMFGENSVLKLSFPAAVKTGTSNDYRDNWTLGFTPDIAVGVWVGNADYTPMEGVTGLTGAAPIWAEIMRYAIQNSLGGNPSPFIKPEGIVERVICAVSGTVPSQWCSNQRSEYFAADQLPLPSSEDLWTKIVFDTWTGFRASSACPDFTKEEFAVNISDPWAIGWIQNNAEGKAWVEKMGFTEPILFVPPRECQESDPHPIIEISSPREGQTITISPVDIAGRIDASADFRNFLVEYGVGNEPSEWKELLNANQPVSQVGKVYSWDLNSITPGIISLKITIHNIRGGYAEREYHYNIQVSTPTPTNTPSPTPTFTPTQTFTPTYTPSPSLTPTPSQTPAATSSPTSTTPSDDSSNP